MLVHIGYHKTATSWFQRFYFPQHPSFTMPLSYDEIASLLVYPHDLEFEPGKVRRRLAQPGAQAGVPVLSCERLSGNPHSGGYDSRVLADRIAAGLPHARVWIAIRRQEGAVAANYRQYVREGGTGSLEAYVQGDPPERIPSFRLGHFEYHHLIRYYVKLFGRDRVLVTTYEDFARHPESVVAQLEDFAGVQSSVHPLPADAVVNRSFSDMSVRLLRIANVFSRYPSMAYYPPLILPGRRMLRRVLTALEGVVPRPKSGRTRLDLRVERLTAGRFGTSNRELASMMGLDLASRGYQA